MRRPVPRTIHSARHTRYRVAALFVLSGGVARCGDAPMTQLLVAVTTQPAEGLPLEAVEIEVQSEDTLTTYDRARFPIVGAAGGRFSLPLTFGVAPRAAGLGRVRVLARGRLRAGSAARPLEVSAVTTFVTGQKLLLPLVLDYRCTLHPPCAPGLSCSTQECASEMRAAATLRPVGPDDAPPATGSTCARPAEDCIDRCAEGTRVPVSRFVNGAMQTTLTTTPATPPCCGGQVLAARDVFHVSPTPRPDLLPLYVCRAPDNTILYSLREGCEGLPTNDGILGYVVSPATPGRCGTVPLYRLYAPLTFDHYYTTHAGERDGMVARGYVFELITGYVWPGPTGGCGPTRDVCAVANATAACTNGVCGVASCAAGFVDCDDRVANGCEVNTQTSAAHCGACGRACPTGRVCRAGACGCPLGEVDCGGVCVDLTADTHHCGACGRGCPTGRVCRGATCQSACASGHTRCGTQCVRLGENLSHCGVCDNACAVGSACASGRCVAAASVDPVGCADGTREAFTDPTMFPRISGCSGAWSLPGVFPAIPASTDTACATLGNSSTAAPTDGAGCAASNLCALGWHLCNSGEILPRTLGVGCDATTYPSSTFFAAGVSGMGDFRCALRTNTMLRCTDSVDCQEHGDLNNDFFGCGSLGRVAVGPCDGLNRTAGNACEDVFGTTWRCARQAEESRIVTKVGSANGGVLCCRE